MMRFFALLLSGVTLFGAAAAKPEQPVLVELFANQNCPACPKAHRAMQQISEERDDVFVLTWTVNYWDYLGEPDPMSLPASKDRQMAYTDRLSLRAPYTPQSFYDGAKECPGTRRKDIRRNIEQRLDDRAADRPQIEWDGADIRVSGVLDDALEVTVVEYLSGDANETNMVNPVTSVRSLGLWVAADNTFPVSCSDSCVVLLHEQDAGEVIAIKALN